MNRSMLTLALCLALAPLAAGCDTEVDSEDADEEAGKTQDQAQEGEGGGDVEDGGEDGEDDGEEEGDADTTDADIDECMQGTSESCGNTGVRFCWESDTQPQLFVWGECDESGSEMSTPLVLSFDGAEPAMTAGASGAFDLSAKGVHGATDWPSARTPWLAIDRDGDGRIADGGELFGSGARLSSGALASQGFEALTELDGNRDGVIDAADPRFGELLVWSDEDDSRTSQGHEIAFAAQRGIVSIELASRSEVSCDARGNCGVERARFTFRGEDGQLRAGEVVDVHLAYQR